VTTTPARDALLAYVHAPFEGDPPPTVQAHAIRLLGAALAEDRAAHAAEVRAAAFDEMAKKQASRAEADAIRRRHSIATARRLVAAELREEAAAARTDNTTGA
jgi:hypothetical protein